ncbi:hypothetical protein A4A49_02714 [Nicotiana attenuata]|uniref:Retrovirus-related Pol polyprotein from transposon TNT 1-94-like beta-barrel domain-containing protein n=1 Tax=Nicotiana attenuata TaxID=49451 RepID=A0A314L1J5_NICAT|nr:hypothetical protein A4A49_02714 [Nicotiana attenuata]
MASNTFSTASLHHLIASCPVKLKPSNYLIWRTQMMQLIQVMRLNYLIEGKPEIINVEGTSESSVKNSGKGVDKDSTAADWAEKNVLLRSWISGTMSEEIELSMNILKEFKGICDGLASIHKPVDDDSKVINFARGDDSQQVNHNMAFAAQRTYNNRCRGRRGNMNYSSRGRGFRPAGQNNHQNNQGSGNVAKGHETTGSSACQICGRNNHTAIKCFYIWDFSYQALEELPQALATLNVNSQNGGDNAHYMDSGASTRMTNNSGNLSNLKPYNENDKIIVGNGQQFDITHVWKGTISSLRKSEVLVVPKLKKNLLSENRTDSAPNDSSHMATFFEFFSESQTESGSSDSTAVGEMLRADHDDDAAANTSNNQGTVLRAVHDTVADQSDGVESVLTAAPTADHKDAVGSDHDEVVEVTHSITELSADMQNSDTNELHSEFSHLDETPM